MLEIKDGRLNGYIKIQPRILWRYMETHPELKPYVHIHIAGSHMHLSIDDMPVPAKEEYRTGREYLSIEEFDAFYSLAKDNDASKEPMHSSNEGPLVKAIIDTVDGSERNALIDFVKERFPSTKSGLFEAKDPGKGFQMVAFHEGEGFGFVGVYVAKDLRKKGFDHLGSVDEFITKYGSR